MERFHYRPVDTPMFGLTQKYLLVLNQNYPSTWQDITESNIYKKSSWNNLKPIGTSVKGVKTNWSQPYYDRIKHQRSICSFCGVCCELFLPYTYFNKNISWKICICHIFEGNIAYLNMNKKNNWNNLETIRTSVKNVRAYWSHSYYGRIWQYGSIRSFCGVCYELFLPYKWIWYYIRFAYVMFLKMFVESQFNLVPHR